MPKLNLDAGAEKIGQDKPLDLDEKSIIERPDQKVEAVDGPLSMDYAAELAFNEERVEIVVSESTDQNADNPIQLGVQGIPLIIFRGEQVAIKRKYVEVLARAKQTDVRTEVVHRGAGAEPINRVNKRTALKYPFTVVSDPNPKGAAWLKKILAEA